jgi:N-acetyl-alpha-D-muramate 1-phosphate uridylyltransferase
MPSDKTPVLPVMLFAAGFGTRMQALTAHQPKPLIPVAGKPLIDHALGIVDAAGASPIVVNLHYRGEQIRRHLRQRPEIRFADEPGQILETGGGLRAALPLLGAGTVFTLNTDAVWTGQNPLQQLRAAWRPDVMDCLLLVLPARAATGHHGKADFALGPAGQLRRGGQDESHVYLGAQIIKTDRLAGFDPGAFSLNLLWTEMISLGRAFGVVHTGGWCDVGHPEGIVVAETMLRDAPP